jgi:predicted O-methyltransferase YrrM
MAAALSSVPRIHRRDMLRCLVKAVDAGFRNWGRGTAVADRTGFEQVWRTTREIPGWLNEENAAVLWAVIQDQGPRTIVEIGSYLGRSTVLLGLAMRGTGDLTARVIAVDPHTGDRQQLDKLGMAQLPSLDMFRLHVQGAGLSDVIEERVAKSEEVARSSAEPIDLLYIDGWHSYSAVCADAKGFARWLSPAGLVCFDDYSGYEEVRRAVVDSCEYLGLTLYGTVFGQAWAGVSGRPPAPLARAARVTTLCPVGNGTALRSVRRHFPGFEEAGV